MDFGLVILYQICYSAGLLAIFTAAMLWVRSRNPLNFGELLLMSGLMAINVNLSISAAFGFFFANSPTVFSTIISFLLSGGISLMTFAVSWYMYLLRPGRVTKAARVIFGILSIFLFIAWILLLLIAGINILMFLFIVMLLTIVFSIFCCIGVLILRGWKVLQDPSFRTYAIIGLVSLILMPLVVLSDYLGLKVAAISFARQQFFLPAFYGIWAILILFLRAPELCKPVKPSHALDNDSPSVPRQNELTGRNDTLGSDPVNPLFRRFEISEREYEVLTLLIQGLSYSRIAQKLFISHSTVKTHVASVYRKTGTKGKVELANLVRDIVKTDN
jgi:DNA-binding CsgD family transcriptional regulator